MMMTTTTTMVVVVMMMMMMIVNLLVNASVICNLDCQIPDIFVK